MMMMMLQMMTMAKNDDDGEGRQGTDLYVTIYASYLKQ